MAEVIRRPNVRDIDAAVRLYYEKFELSSKDIRAIFDAKSTQTISKLKNIVREEMTKEGRLPWDSHNVPTDVAFKAWGLDIADLERRRVKLMKLMSCKGNGKRETGNGEAMVAGNTSEEREVANV